MIAAIALGSNLHSTWGSPADALHEARHRLQALGRVTGTSRFFETEPVGLTEQPQFLNAAALLETELGPLELLRALLGVEQSMGRVRAADVPPKGPRIIDLDLLLYADEHGRGLILSDPDLILPHPAMHERRFVLEPLAEIAAAMQHPVFACTVGQLLERLGPGRA